MTKKKFHKKQNLSANSNVKSIYVKPVENTSNNKKSVHGIKGLLNLGNTCYLNSMLQMLLHSPCFLNELRAYCSMDQTLVTILEDKKYELVLKTNDVSIIEKELLIIWESEKEMVSPCTLRNALLQHKDFKTHFNGFNEQDSHEVFLMVLNIIREAQIKRIRGAILDCFDSRKISYTIDVDIKKKIKDISVAVEKQTLVNSVFGIIVASNLKCQNCGELRMRFDEVLHIAPMFPAKHEIELRDTAVKKSEVPTNQSHLEHVVLMSANQPIVNEKSSKHQLKRQKRFEKKAARNKKSALRNTHCSPEEMHPDEPTTVDENIDEATVSRLNDAVDDVGEETVSPSSMDIVEEEHEVAECCVVSGGNDGGCVDEDFVMQQLIYDSLTTRDQFGGSEIFSRHSSTNDSMNVHRNNSGLTSLGSSADLEMFVEDKFGQLTVEYDNVDRMPLEDDGERYYTAENTLSQGTERVEEDSDVEVQSVTESAAPGVHVVVEDTEEMSVSHCGDADKHFLQTAFSATLETHQDRLYDLNDDKRPFEIQTDLDVALARFNVPIFLENIVCETCSGPKVKRQTDHIKTDVICHLPRILPFYISRFKQTIARNRAKNTEVYSYPFILNLSSQCSKYANFASQSMPVLYRLFGIIEHIGARINTGHYVSYVSRPISTDTQTTSSCSHPYPANMLTEISRKHLENKCGRFESQRHQESDNMTPISEPCDYQWFRVSDHQVESVAHDSVMRIQAFMLFYYRIQ